MSEDLTVGEVAANYELSKHCRLVAKFLHKVVVELLDRADKHDLSKFERPEVTQFGKAVPLDKIVYDSVEYKDNLKTLYEALDHHYANADHHPQHFKNGVNDMNLLQIVEMVADWAASCKRNCNGNLRKSIEVNGNRFGLSPQLVKIMENTAAFFDE